MKKALKAMLKRFEDEMAAASVAQEGAHSLAVEILKDSEAQLARQKDETPSVQGFVNQAVNPAEGN